MMRRLSGAEVRAADAIFDALYPAPPRRGHGRLARSHLAALIRTLPFAPAMTLRFALWVVMFAPVWLWQRPTAFVRLRRKERQLLLAAVLANQIYVLRQLALALRAAGAFALFKRPAIGVRFSPERPPLREPIRRDLPRGARRRVSRASLYPLRRVPRVRLPG